MVEDTDASDSEIEQRGTIHALRETAFKRSGHERCKIIAKPWEGNRNRHDRKASSLRSNESIKQQAELRVK